MLKQLQKRRSASDGFTIIEVLIVLAIAGLIMVIVFLAVPALQRSQRNQSRKTDVNNLMSSISDFTGNNGGVPPSTQANITTASNNTKFGYYKAPGNIFFGGTPTATVSPATTTPAADVNSTEEINVYIGYTCTTATGVATKGNSRNVAIQYVVEQASNDGQLECVSS